MSTRASRSNTIAVLQTVAPAYRETVFDFLAEHLGSRFVLMAGDVYFDRSVKTEVTVTKAVKNHFLLGRSLLVQSGMWKTSLEAAALAIELNPRVITNWALLIVRRVLRRRTVLWGHAWPRAGKDSRSDWARHAMRCLGHGIVVYTETQAKELSIVMPRKQIMAAPNALYRRQDMGSLKGPTEQKHFVFVGRLIPGKKPDLLLRAWAQAVQDLPSGAKLLIVGDGPMRRELEHLAEALHISSQVEIMGQVYATSDLRSIYASALASVSPGYVGLSITQSLSFGVPMIIAREEPHAPEIEAAIPDFNSVFFAADSVECLRHAIIEVWRDRNAWVNKREEIAANCMQAYSVETMVDRLLEALTGEGLCTIDGAERDT